MAVTRGASTVSTLRFLCFDSNCVLPFDRCPQIVCVRDVCMCVGQFPPPSDSLHCPPAKQRDAADLKGRM